MRNILDIFSDKKILIYGLGKTGISTFNFLKKKCKVFLFDDVKKNLRLSKYKFVLKSNFDYIIISPGIDINNCKLSKFLKKNSSKIYSDLDIFYSFYKNDCITITGTNGKSTVCQILYEVLRKHKRDVKLVGNIGNPILSVKKIKPKTIFVIEASSYQLEYSKIFKSKYGVILNITPDHIERHKTINKYVKAKFKLLKHQSKKSFGFVKNSDPLIKKELKNRKFDSRVIKVRAIKIDKVIKKLGNSYFFTEENKENLSFVLAISRKLKLKNNLIFTTIKKYKGLKYRQQIIYKKHNLTIINDSKSTSFSSSVGILKSCSNIYWLLGGMHKKGDKFKLPKRFHKRIKAFIFGQKQNFFNKQLNGKIKYENFDNLKDALKNVLMNTKDEAFLDKTILFSPSAASFDSFKNFEDRGLYFNKLIGKYLNVK